MADREYIHIFASRIIFPNSEVRDEVIEVLGLPQRYASSSWQVSYHYAYENSEHYAMILLSDGWIMSNGGYNEGSYLMHRPKVVVEKNEDPRDDGKIGER